MPWNERALSLPAVTAVPIISNRTPNKTINSNITIAIGTSTLDSVASDKSETELLITSVHNNN